MKCLDSDNLIKFVETFQLGNDEYYFVLQKSSKYFENHINATGVFIFLRHESTSLKTPPFF
jgi:hypothetical protein